MSVDSRGPMSSCLRNHRAEQYIVGQLANGVVSLQDPSIQLLSPGMFTSSTYRRLFISMRELDLSKVQYSLNDTALPEYWLDKGDDVINDEWLADLAIASSASGDINRYVGQVKEAHARRAAIAQLKKLSFQLQTVDGIEAPEIQIPLLATRNSLEELNSNLELEVDNEKLAEEMVRPPLSEWKFGHKTIDKLTGGIQAGEISIVAGRTGNGKTSFCADMAVKLLDSGRKVLFMSLEMPAFRIGRKIISNKLGIDEWNELNDEQLDACKGEILDQLEKQWDGRLTIMDEEQLGRDPFQMLGKVAHLKPDVIFYDFITFGLSGGEVDMRFQIQRLLEDFRSSAKSKDFAMIAVAQCNRASTNRDDPLPRVSDLAEAGQLEQYAANILFVFNPAAMFPDVPVQPGDFKVVIGKTRFEGGSGTVVPYNFDGARSRFTEVA